MRRKAMRVRRDAAPRAKRSSPPLIWTFDGPFATCLGLSLPALAARVDAGDALQPAWSDFLDRVAQRYGLPGRLRVRHRTDAGPLATLVIVYRS
jgi:hypothetical protein